MPASRPKGRPATRVGLSEADRRSWENSYARTHFSELPWYSARPSPWLLRSVREGWIPRGATVLDVGCGAGTNVLWLGRHGFRASGVDIAPSAIRAAERRAASARLDVHFQVADVLDLPFPRGSFAAALDSGCFHALPIRLRRRYVDELARVLRPDAPFLITWVGREETRSYGPPHRPSLTEMASVFEPRFLFRTTEFHPSRSGGSWVTPGGRLVTYSARLTRRTVAQPPPR
jgi:SAM-dependent methyltransferase